LKVAATVELPGAGGFRRGTSLPGKAVQSSLDAREPQLAARCGRD
jgi:hypothetical protein